MKRETKIQRAKTLLKIMEEQPGKHNINNLLCETNKALRSNLTFGSCKEFAQAIRYLRVVLKKPIVKTCESIGSSTGSTNTVTFYELREEAYL